MGDLKPYQETTDVQQQNFTNIGRLERGEKKHKQTKIYNRFSNKRKK